MNELEVMTTRGSLTALPAPVVEAFQTRLRGALLRPGEAAYETTCASRMA
jgi:hypothetical protein